MKVLVCYVILMLMCVFVQVQADCEYEGESLPVGKHYRNCLAITCVEDNSILVLGCAEARCREEEQIGYQELDLSKPYPECCPRPICKD